MKRLMIMLLILALMLSCTACGVRKEAPTQFYYLLNEEAIRYGETDGFISPVAREISEDTHLDVVLQLYLDGPVEEDYRNPFPKGTYLLSTIEKEDMLLIVLSREFSTLDGIELTLAGACLSATCCNLTGMEKIQVRSGESIYDFDLNSFIFLDNSAGK